MLLYSDYTDLYSRAAALLATALDRLPMSDDRLNAALHASVDPGRGEALRQLAYDMLHRLGRKRDLSRALLANGHLDEDVALRR